MLVREFNQVFCGCGWFFKRKMELIVSKLNGSKDDVESSDVSQINLSGAAFEQLVELVENPPKPTSALRALMLDEQQ